MDGDLSLTDILNVDFKLLKALILHYTLKYNNLNDGELWEQIISRSCRGKWIPGDKYMADAVKDCYGLNIKSKRHTYNKKDTQIISYVQCRAPIANENNLSDQEIGEKIIETLVSKRNESLDDLNLEKIIDVIVVHNREGDYYNVRIFFTLHPNYEDYTYDWKDGCGYLPNETKWKLNRNPSDSNYGQSVLNIKNNYSLSDCDFDFRLYCPLVREPTDDELIQYYEDYVTQNKRND